MDKIYIAIPIYNDYEHVLRLIGELKNELSNYYDVRFIIGDASDKDHAKEISMPDVLTIKISPSNYWGGTINKIYGEIVKNKDIKESIVIIANDDICIKNDINNIINISKKKKGYIFHPTVKNRLGDYVSSGSIVISWIPYITRHIKGIHKDTRIDLGTTRFLVMSGESFLKIDSIPNNLPHYGGDNYITYKLWKEHNIPTYVTPLSTITLYEDRTGIKNKDIVSMKSFLASFSDIKSTNNIKTRYKLLRNFHSVIVSNIIIINMIIIIIMKQIISKKN